MFCGQCGKELPEGARFCSNCGAGTEDKLSYAQPQPVEREKATRKFRLKMIIPICVAAVAVVTVLGVTFLRTTHGSSGKHIYYEDALALQESGDYVWWDDFDFCGAIGEYRSDGKPIWEIMIGSEGPVGPMKIMYEYDTCGNLVKVHTNTGDRCSILEYDRDRNLIRRVGTGGSDFAPEGEYDVFEYDAAGNLIKKACYNREGNVTDYNEYEYDAAGNLIREMSYWKFTQEDSVNLKNSFEYSYDATGNIVSTMIYWEGSLSGYIKYEYDTSGNNKKVTYYGEDGSISSYTEYEYDASGNKKKETNYGRDGSISTNMEYEYDMSGNLTRENHCNADGSISFYLVYRYGTAGNLIYRSRMYYIEKEGKWEGDEREYNADGNIVKKKSNYRDKIDGYICEYDKQGRRIKATYYNEDGSLGKYYIYKYDSAGNFKKIASYDETDTLLGYKVYEYDKDDNITKITSYNETDILQGYTTYKYDKNGYITQYGIYDESEKLQYYFDCEYDKNGKLICVTKYDGDGNVMYE